MPTCYKNVARVTKTQGAKGEVVVAALRGLPFLLTKNLSVCLTPPALKRPRWIRVEAVAPYGDDARVKFEGIDDLDAAESIVGCTVLVHEDDIELDELDVAFDDLIDVEVEDPRYGVIGRIVEVMETPANDVWVIDGGAYGEVLLPVIDQVVTSIPDEGPIQVHVLDGLLELS